MKTQNLKSTSSNEHRSKEDRKQHGSLDSEFSRKIKENFSEAIFAYCEKTKRTQAEVADELGVSRQTIYHYLIKQNCPSLAVIQRAHRVFGVSYEELIDGKESVSEEKNIHERFRKLPDKDKKCIEYIIECFEQISQV